MRGVERSHWGVVGGRAGRLADVCFPPAGSAEQFMNDSPHCQADSLLSWGLGGGGEWRGGGGWLQQPPLYDSDCRTRTHTGHAHGRTRALAGRGGSSGSTYLLRSVPHRWVSGIRGRGLQTIWFVEKKSEVSV